MRKEFSCVPRYIAQDREGLLTVFLAEDRAELGEGLTAEPKALSNSCRSKTRLLCIGLFLSSRPPLTVGPKCQNSPERGKILEQE